MYENNCFMKYICSHKFEDLIPSLKKIATDSIVYYKHAAALVSGNNIHGFSSNKYIKEIIVDDQKYYITRHAEISLFEKLPKKQKVRGMDIIVIRINKNLELRNSRPCNNCIDKLLKLGIRKVYYSNDKGDIVCELVEQMEKIHISSGEKFLCNL